MFDYELKNIIERQKETIDTLQSLNDGLMSEVRVLSSKNKALEELLPCQGLSLEELQGIHGLIQKQIEIIKNAQESDSKNALSSGVSDLLKLASLVSKPTEK